MGGCCKNEDFVIYYYGPFIDVAFILAFGFSNVKNKYNLSRACKCGM